MLLEPAAFGLAAHVQDLAVGIELPAVIETAQPAFLVAAEGERGLAMRAMLAEDPEPAAGVAKDDEILAQKPRAHRRAVGRGDFFGHAGGQPVPAHDPPHRGIAFDTAEEIVLFGGEHGP